MQAAILSEIAEALAPLVVGGTVTDVRAPAPDCLVLAVSRDAPVWLCALAMKALPVVFVSQEAPVASGAGDSGSAAARELRGARVTSFAAIDGEPVAVLGLTREDSAGRSVARTLRIDLGRRPSLSLRGAHGGPAPAGESGAPANSVSGVPRPAIAWGHDAAGRLHVRLAPGGGSWEGTKRFETWNEAACYAFREFFPELRLERLRARVEKAVGRRLKRKLRAIEKVEAEAADADRAGDYRHKAQLLLTRQGDVQRGRSPVHVLDFDATTRVEIEVDPAISPARNAEALFRRARKAERRAERAPRRLAELRDRVRELRGALDEVATASHARLAELEAEFRPPPPGGARRKDGPRARFRTFTVSGGWEVLVGKSNRDNDILTHKMARSDDLWFHVRQAAGSHVILRRAGRKAEPDSTAIMEAAGIAAYYSKAGRSSNVPVCYTERRHVRKPRGAKPGLAVVSREKVVFVQPRLPGDSGGD